MGTHEAPVPNTPQVAVFLSADLSPPGFNRRGGTMWLHCACVATAERFDRASSAAESYKYAGRRRSFCYLNFKFARDRFVSRIRPLAKRARFIGDLVAFSLPPLPRRFCVLYKWVAVCHKQSDFYIELFGCK